MHEWKGEGRRRLSVEQKPKPPSRSCVICLERELVLRSTLDLASPGGISLTEELGFPGPWKQIAKAKGAPPKYHRILNGEYKRNTGPRTTFVATDVRRDRKQFFKYIAFRKNVFWLLFVLILNFVSFQTLLSPVSFYCGCFPTSLYFILPLDTYVSRSIFTKPKPQK